MKEIAFSILFAVLLMSIGLIAGGMAKSDLFAVLFGVLGICSVLLILAVASRSKRE